MTKEENRSYKKSQHLLNKTQHGAETTAQFKVKRAIVAVTGRSIVRENSCFRQTSGDYKLELDIY